MTRPNTRSVALALVAVYVIWGSTYLAMRIAVEGLPPFMMATGRYLVCGAILFVFLRARGAAWPTRREWLNALPVGALMFVTGNGTVAVAEQHLSSGVAAVVCGTMPLWLAALGHFFGERASVREWFALVLGFIGVVLLSMGGELRGDPVSALILFVAPISWAAGSLLARRLTLAKGMMSAATQMIAGGAVMALVSLAFGERVPESVPTNSLLAWAYLSTAGSLLAYTAYTYLLANTRPAIATSYAYVNPIVAVGIGVALGGEHAGPEVLVAVLLIAGATLLVMMKPKTAPVPAAASASVVES